MVLAGIFYAALLAQAGPACFEALTELAPTNVEPREFDDAAGKVEILLNVSSFVDIRVQQVADEIVSHTGMTSNFAVAPANIKTTMLDLATGDDHPVDFIVATDMARIARGVEFSILTEGRLRRAGVALRFVLQEFQDGHNGLLMKLVTSWQDQEYVIKAAFNTRRGLRGTAAEGFWPGGVVPLGYESRTAEVRGKKEKKKLFINETEAELVRFIFDLAERGFEGSPMGARSIAEHLNANGYTLRGRKFHNSNVADLLQRPRYLGRFPGSKVDEHGNLLPEDEWIWVDCPQIISQEQFDRVAALRASRAPRVTPPHVMAGTTLLVGIARCGMPGCGCGMTIRTGKSGQYRYYACNSAVNRGVSSCGCPKVRAEKLDELVTRAVADEVFSEERLRPLLQKMLDTSDEARARKLADLQRSEEQLEAARKRLSRIHDAIELGTMSARDPDVRERLKDRRAEIDALNATIISLRQQLDRGPTSITPAAVTRFGEVVRQRLIEGDSKARQRIIHDFVSAIRIGEQVTIQGESGALAHGVASLARNKQPVPSFDRKWCGREDSNFHGLSPTTTSTLRVYQFRHDRTRVCRGGASPKAPR